MEKKLTQDQIKQLEKLSMKIAEINAIEGSWIDSLMLEKYPKIFVKLGDFAVRKRIKSLQYILIKITKWSGYSLDIQRSPEIEMPKKGFKKGTTLYKSMKTVVKMGEITIGVRKFDINIPVQADFKTIMSSI